MIIRFQDVLHFETPTIKDAIIKGNTIFKTANKFRLSDVNIIISKSSPCDKGKYKITFDKQHVFFLN